MKKSNIKQILAITGLSLLLFAAVLVSTVAVEIATAESASATRVLPVEPVSAGEFFSVRIEASDYGVMGQVLETLPAGFKYETSTLDPDSVEVIGNTVKFYLLANASFNYTVIASEREGTYDFSGLLIDVDNNESEVGGAKEIKVEPATAIATRTLLAESISPGASFTIGIETSGYGIMSQVKETLPAGFTYVNSTLDPGSVEITDNTVKFTLFGESSFNYTVRASNTVGTYLFSGKLIDMDMREYKVGGDKEIVVESATATRILPSEPVSPGANISVGIDLSGYGVCGQVIEMLPPGFAYVNATLDPSSVEGDAVNNTVKFTLFGENSFNYTAAASNITGTYNFTGVLKDMNMNEYVVGGDTKIVVGPMVGTSGVGSSIEPDMEVLGVEKGK